MAEETGGFDEETAEGSISTGGTGAGAETFQRRLEQLVIEETGAETGMAETGTTGASEKTGAIGVGTGSTGVILAQLVLVLAQLVLGLAQQALQQVQLVLLVKDKHVEKGMIFKDGRCHIATPKKSKKQQKKRKKRKRKNPISMLTVEQRLEHAAKRDMGSEMRHEKNSTRNG